MSRVGELHKRMMLEMDCAMGNLIGAESRLENDPDYQREEFRFALESVQAARSFLVEAQKLAAWLDTGEA